MKKKNKSKTAKEGMIVLAVIIAAFIGMYVYPEINKHILILAIIATFVVGISRPIKFKAGNTYFVAKMVKGINDDNINEIEGRVIGMIDTAELEKLKKKAYRLAEQNDLPQALDISDLIINQGVTMNLNDDTIIEGLVKGSPSVDDCLLGEAQMMIGKFLIQKLEELYSQNTIGQFDQAIIEAEKAADSCLWTAAAYQIAIRHLEGTIRAMLHICDFRLQREICDQMTYDLISLVDHLINQLDRAHKYCRCQVELHKMLEITMKKYLDMASKK